METRRDVAWPAAVAVGLVALTAWWGEHSNRSLLQLDAPPFVGRWDLRLSPRVLLPAAVALLLWYAAPLALRVPWRRLLLGAWGAAALWAVSLALVDGAAGIREPLTSKDEYLSDVGRVGSGFLSTFTDFVVQPGPDRWSTHVSGHPPGFLLLCKGLDTIGLGGPWPAALLCVAVGTSAVVAVLLAVRAVVDEATARRAAPFLALAPAAVWVAVSADGLYLGVLAWGIALLALRRWFAGGLLLGGGLLLTYGALPLGLLAAALLRGRRGWLLAAAGALAPLAVFAAFGFWWPDGLHQSLIRVHAGAGGYRPYGYFLLANLAAVSVAVGAATLVGLRALRRADRLWWLVAPALAALLVADLSGASRGEVERVWLPFTPWLVVACARLVHPRLWLAVQLGTGLAVQVVLRSKW